MYSSQRKQGDIVLICLQDLTCRGIPIFERPHNYGEVFLDHCHIKADFDNEINRELAEYKKKLAKLKPTVGSIVMNCNPFTLGHRYLIEYVANKVEKLFIFVVEEDKSEFPFRIELNLFAKAHQICQMLLCCRVENL